jgi:hypothetical protein
MSAHGDLMGTNSLVRFQEKADEAGVVVFIVSKDFIESKTCRQQVGLSIAHNIRIHTWLHTGFLL